MMQMLEIIIWFRFETPYIRDVLPLGHIAKHERKTKYFKQRESWKIELLVYCIPLVCADKSFWLHLYFLKSLHNTLLTFRITL